MAIDDYDVIIAGGGLAGTFTAVDGSRLKRCLLERAIPGDPCGDA